MWSAILTVAPKLLGFLGKKAEKNPKTGLAGLAGVGALFGQIITPDTMSVLRNALAAGLQMVVDALKVAPISG